MKQDEIQMPDYLCAAYEGDDLYTGDQVRKLIARVLDKKHNAVKCDPQPAITEDGFSNWVCPIPAGYLMQCCDCGLIHEVEFRVAKYESDKSDEFEVVEDKNIQVQFRMRRYE